MHMHSKKMVMFAELCIFAFVPFTFCVDALEWKSTYTVKGTIHIPTADIAETFQAWYDHNSRRSRIDYYDGKVKTYLRESEGENLGKIMKIEPKLFGQKGSSCAILNGTREYRIVRQTVLPSLEGFEYMGKEVINEIEAEIWQLNVSTKTEVDRHTVWIRQDSNKNHIIPIKYEMYGFHNLGFLYDLYYLEYDSFDIGAINASIFEFDSGRSLTCDYVTPTLQQIFAFNPMRELIYPMDRSHLDYAFAEFVKKYNKDFKDLGEYYPENRKRNFRQNIRFIHSHNRQHNGYVLAINQMAEYEDYEFEYIRGRARTSEYNGGLIFPYKDVSSVNYPEEYDYRINGSINAIADQGRCGSGWAFASIGTVESAYFQKYQKLVSLAPQTLIDCTRSFAWFGCEGGTDAQGYKWIQKNKGIPSSLDYCYTGKDHDQCRTKLYKNIKLHISGYVNVTSGDEKALKLAIFKHGPISISIDARHRAFNFYSKGVYFQPTCEKRIEKLNHSVLVVGYGTFYGKKYWLVRNSYSQHWGDGGYMLMALEENDCGVTTVPTLVVM